MGFFEEFLRPKKVQDAMLAGDAEALSAMGKKGAEHAAELKDIRKEKATTEQVEAALERAKAYSVSAEGEVLPPDPAAVETLEEKLKPH